MAGVDGAVDVTVETEVDECRRHLSEHGIAPSSGMGGSSAAAATRTFITRDSGVLSVCYLLMSATGSSVTCTVLKYLYTALNLGAHDVFTSV